MLSRQSASLIDLKVFIILSYLIFSKCPPFYSKKTRIKQNVWFWHTFQNKSVIYSPQFFFYCWSTAVEICFFWLDFVVFLAFVFCCIIIDKQGGLLVPFATLKTLKHPNTENSSACDVVPPATSYLWLWQWLMAGRNQTILGSASVTGERRQFIPFSPSAVNNNLRKGSGLIIQSLPGWGRETAVSMYADGRPSLVLVKNTLNGRVRREHLRF